VLAAVSGNVCVFYERDRRRCAIHRQVGPALLPVACRQFPRVTLLDGRGLFVNVSHCCPTAAALLFEDAELAIVPDPAAFPPDFHYDPLDARETLPPLLTPRVLMDLPAYDEWERRVVGLLADGSHTAEEALSAAIAFTEEVRSWRPRAGGKTLGEHVSASRVRDHWSRSLRTPLLHPDSVMSRVAVDYALVLDCVPEAFRPSVSHEGQDTGRSAVRDLHAAIRAGRSAARARHLGRLDEVHDEWVVPRWHLFDAPLRRYLAAKIFGTWLAYQGHGLRTTMFSLVVALSLVRAHAAIECAAMSRPLDRALFTAAIRRSDELLLHLASREDLARRFSEVEGAMADRGPTGVTSWNVKKVQFSDVTPGL
jgi:hypothetical protein